jgi:alkanesulfonate monooxygenase SsuD/methylene tetrahydromethanopterin reductase-like flavin-dependent oxidoreductase (luciferase family)
VVKATPRRRGAEVTALWSSDVAEYHGKFVDFAPSWSYPKPLQDPLPILVGGMGPTVENRVLRCGDQWLAEAVGTGADLDEFAVRVGTLQKRATEQDRDRIPVSMFDAESSSKEAFDRYAAAGVDRCLFQLPDGDAETVVPELNRLAGLIS